MINLVVITTTQSLHLANWTSYPQAERTSVIFYRQPNQKRFLLNGFGWVKYWRMAFNLPNLPKYSLPEFCAIIIRYKKVNHNSQITLQPSTKQVFTYESATQLHVLGSFDTTITVKNNWTISTLQVLEGSHGSLLGYSTAVALGILNMQLHHITSTPIHEQLFRQYPAPFEGIGQLKGVEVKLHIDTKVPLVAQKARRIPFHLRKKVEHELKILEEQHII